MSDTIDFAVGGGYGNEIRMARIQHSGLEVRAECSVCGAHAYVVPGVPQAGNCGNCGSLDLRELPAG